MQNDQIDTYTAPWQFEGLAPMDNKTSFLSPSAIPSSSPTNSDGYSEDDGPLFWMYPTNSALNSAVNSGANSPLLNPTRPYSMDAHQQLTTPVQSTASSKLGDTVSQSIAETYLTVKSACDASQDLDELLALQGILEDLTRCQSAFTNNFAHLSSIRDKVSRLTSGPGSEILHRLLDGHALTPGTEPGISPDVLDTIEAAIKGKKLQPQSCITCRSAKIKCEATTQVITGKPCDSCTSRKRQCAWPVQEGEEPRHLSRGNSRSKRSKSRSRNDRSADRQNQRNRSSHAPTRSNEPGAMSLEVEPATEKNTGEGGPTQPMTSGPHHPYATSGHMSLQSFGNASNIAGLSGVPTRWDEDLNVSYGGSLPTHSPAGWTTPRLNVEDYDRIPL